MHPVHRVRALVQSKLSPYRQKVASLAVNAVLLFFQCGRHIIDFAQTFPQIRVIDKENADLAIRLLQNRRYNSYSVTCVFFPLINSELICCQVGGAAVFPWHAPCFGSSFPPE